MLVEAHTQGSEFHSRIDGDRSHLSDPHVMPVVTDRILRIRRDVAFGKRVARAQQHVAKRKQSAWLHIEARLSVTGFPVFALKK